MPKLLKKDSIRLIEASIEALALAQIGICTFRRDDLKVESVRYAAEIGLIGSSIELAMNSVLIQAFGKQVIFKEENEEAKYKTASEILHDFRNLLRQSSAVTAFLVNGITDYEKHITEILDLSNRFQIIITSRAHGLHNGLGLSYEITASFFQEVSKFLKLIGESINFKPYLQKVPELIGIKIDRNVLIDDLYNRVNNTNDLNEQKTLLTSLFLILPEIPRDLPEWTKKFQSFNIAPKKNDVVYLINALEQANPVCLKKVNDGANTLNVRVVSSDTPNAIPISPQFLRTEFTQYKEQFYADIATANGLLTSKQLDLPTIKSVYNAFSIDFYDLKILDRGTLFTAHQSWSFIVSAWNIPKNNTNAPFWFMIRKTQDLGQLNALLKKASKLGNESLKNNIDIITKGIESIEKTESVDISSPLYKLLIDNTQKFNKHLEKFQESYKKNKNHELTGEYVDLLNEVFEEEIHVGFFLNKIIHDDSISPEKKKYWVSQLTQVMPMQDDIVVLNEILNNKEYSNSHTNIRKLLRAFDFYLYGPKITPI
ncbi:MAG: hypothetical protein PHV20_00510 [Bacteroidales bacterium]|nr:hypothetical protein [Bacteroidales bacterium]